MTLAHWDPRWKLAAILFACAVVACLQTPAAAAIAFAVSILLAFLARVSTTKLAARLGLIALSLVPFLALLPFVQERGWVLAFTITLRALAIGTLAYVLLATGPVERSFRAARSLGVPGPLVQIVLITHRYSALIVEELRRLRVAWRVRAFQPRTSLHSYRTFAYGLGAVLVRSGERGERVSAAMRARGFDGTFRQLVPFRTTFADVLGSAALMMAMIGIAFWDRLA